MEEKILSLPDSNVIMKKLRAISEVGNGAWDDTEAARRSKLYSLDAFAYLMICWKVLDSSTVVLSALVICTVKDCFQYRNTFDRQTDKRKQTDRDRQTEADSGLGSNSCGLL